MPEPGPSDLRAPVENRHRPVSEIGNVDGAGVRIDGEAEGSEPTARCGAGCRQPVVTVALHFDPFTTETAALENSPT